MKQKSFESGIDDLRSKTIFGFFWRFLERIGSQLVSMVVSILLARLLLPDDYAVVSVVTIFFNFCNIFVSGGLNSALIQKKNADKTDYATILFTSIFLAAVLYGLLFVLAPVIADLYHIDLLVDVIRVMGLGLFIEAIKGVLSAYTSSNLQFKNFFYATFIGVIISAIVGIVMAKQGFGAWALVAQQLTNSTVGTLILLLVTKFHISFVFSFQRLKQLFSYGWKIVATSFLSVFYDQISPLIVGVRFSAVDLSFYTKGKSFPGLLDSTITSTLSSVLFPVMSKLQDDKEQILSITRRYIQVASYILFPIMVGFFSTAEVFVNIVLTEKWLPAVPYIQIFCISYMFNIIQIGNLEEIKAIGISDISLILEIIKKSIYFVIILAFVLFSNSPQLLAVSSIICSLIALVVNTYPNRRLIGYRYRYQIIDIIPNLVISLIVGVIVFWLGKIQVSSLVLIVLQVFSGTVIYILLSIITKNKNFKYILTYIKGIMEK